MTNTARGIAAGLAATMVLSMIMVAKGMMGLMPELNVIAMLSSMLMALWVHIAVWNHPFFAPNETMNGSWELPALYACGTLMLVLCGPVQVSLDHVLRGGDDPEAPPAAG